MIKFPREFSGHIKKLQSHKKQARMFKLCALSQVPKPFITRCHNHHHISLLNTRLLSWQEGNWLGECFSTKELYGRHTGHHSHTQLHTGMTTDAKLLFTLPFQDIKVRLLSTTTSPPRKECMPIDKGRSNRVFLFDAFHTNYVTKRDK